MSDKDSPPKAAATAPQFDSRIVTFVVGPRKVRFGVHESTLSQAEAGHFFNKSFTNGFQETNTGCMELPEDDPEQFRCFLRWLYGIWVQPNQPLNCWTELDFSQQIKLYAFAHKYAIHALHNAIICELHSTEIKKKWGHMGIRREELEFLVANVPDGSPMHRLLADWLIKDELNVI
ncbi:hypothetical protein J7T55_006758 [Diaporthe amygdali]|uniref:uncharacterized protein n=1 Tax=Phomopsis amygdali TaxID=1214568 RepID=UPI0022FEF302|nr:uncharacterized protein J7T55_006758 [Diaporthe amygdali]KAJ0125412.1 hypothetical protein J7T55_006758 [Diaporthe amygdali]